MKSGSVSRSVVSDSLRPHGLEPARLLCPWDSPGKNTSPGDLPDPGAEPGSSTLQADFLPSVPPAKPIYIHTYIFFFKLFPIIGYYTVLNIVPCAMQ